MADDKEVKKQETEINKESQIPDDLSEEQLERAAGGIPGNPVHGLS